jgi:hypothetical protein
LKETIRAPALLPSLALQHPDPGISSYSSDRSAREEKPNLEGFFQDSTCDIFANIPFNKTKSHDWVHSTTPPHTMNFSSYQLLHNKILRNSVT